MKSKRFEPIHDLAARGADELRQAMGAAQRRLSESEHQLAQLQGYREEYLRKAGAANGPLDSVRLQSNRAFLDRIAEAIRQQSQKIGAARVELEACRQRWSEKHVEAEAIGQAVERFRRDERAASDRRDQQDLDDTGLRMWMARRPGGG